MEWLPISFYFLGLLFGSLFGYALCRDRMRKRLEALEEAILEQVIITPPALDLSPEARRERSQARIRQRMNEMIDEYDVESESEA